MKILQVINSLGIGGAEKLLIETVPLIYDAGFEIDVLCLSQHVSPFHELLLHKNCCNLFGITRGSIYNPLIIFKLVPFLKKYDLIHVHLFPALYWVVFAKWISFSKTKIIFTEHSTSNRRMKNRLFNLVDRFVYSAVDKIITISEQVDKIIKEHLRGFKQDRFILIKNGVDLSKIINARPYCKDIFFSHEDFILIQVSAFRIEKDQATLIRSLKYLPDNIKLLLVGDGKYKSENRLLSEKLNLDNRVKFLGVRTDVAELLNTADVAILSTHYEGLSLSCVEGMSVLPFIGSNVIGLKEIVSGFGLLFEQGNEKQLANVILNLSTNESFYAKVKKDCLFRAKQFDIKFTIDSLCSLYSDKF